MQTARQIFAAGLAALLVAAGAQAESAMSVQVKQGPVRATPSFTGKVVGTLNYGQQVQVAEKKIPWLKISADGGMSGWMHESALSKKRFVMSGEGATAPTAASSEELALAGKGLLEVEKQFKMQHPEADFAAVDRMERRKVSQEEKTQFLKDGGIR